MVKQKENKKQNKPKKQEVEKIKKLEEPLNIDIGENTNILCHLVFID